MEPKQVAELVSKTLLDKKGKEVDQIEVTAITVIADFFVICSGSSTTHVRALADEVEVKLKENGIELLRTEGYETARWILLDFGYVVVNVFLENERKFYNLERLWSDGIITRKEDFE